MNELDRIYEEVERLLEASFPAKYSSITQEDLNNALKSRSAKGFSPAYIGDSDQLVLKNKYGDYGTINTNKQFVPYTTGQTKPSKKADYSPDLLKSSNQNQSEQPSTDSMEKLQENPQLDRDELSQNLVNQGYERQGLLKNTNPKAELYKNNKTGDEKKIVLDTQNDDVHIENGDGTKEYPSSKKDQESNPNSPTVVQQKPQDPVSQDNTKSTSDTSLVVYDAGGTPISEDSVNQNTVAKVDKSLKDRTTQLTQQQIAEADGAIKNYITSYINRGGKQGNIEKYKNVDVNAVHQKALDRYLKKEITLKDAINKSNIDINNNANAQNKLLAKSDAQNTGKEMTQSVSTGFQGSEAPDFWTSGQWKNQCNENQDGYFYLKNNPNARVKALDPDKILPNEGHLKLDQNTWYLVEKFENGKWVSVEKQPIGEVPAESGGEAEKETPDAAQAALNTNTQLNYRLKSVIDSPDIQKQIDASPNGINYVGLNGDKISLITMGESLDSPIEIPSFLLKKLTEAKEVEISSLGAGGQTNLNVFLTPEIQEYLKSQKGNPNITKVMLGKDGLVWLMDDKNNPYLLDDMKVNDNVPAKNQEGNSVNVFINNGGAGNNGNGGNSQSSENQASEVQGNSGPGGREIGHSVTMTDLNALAGPINSKLSKLKDPLSKSISESLKKSLGENYICKFTELKLGKVLEGTYLNESKMHEASDNLKKEEKEEKETAVPKKETSGDCEVYVMEEFSIGSELKESTEKELDKILREALEIIRFKESDDITEEKPDNTDVEDSNPESSKSSEVSENENENEDDQNTSEENKDDDSKMEETVTNILTLSEKSIIDALNKAGSGITSLSNKTKDEGTFTGNSKQITSFSYAPGQESRTGFEATGENNGVYSFKSWFTIIIKKGNSKDSFGTGLNRFGQMLTGIGDMSAKLGMNGKSGLNSVTL